MNQEILGICIEFALLLIPLTPYKSMIRGIRLSVNKKVRNSFGFTVGCHFEALKNRNVHIDLSRRLFNNDGCALCYHSRSPCLLCKVGVEVV